MQRTTKLINLVDSFDYTFSYLEVTSCPICKAHISPRNLSSTLFRKDNGEYHTSVLNYCTACNSTFLSDYIVNRIANDSRTDGYKRFSSCIPPICEPNRFKEKSFDEHIGNLSPSFVKIYNQALAAECASLDEIAGLGYRKSLEFLIKDFAIAEHPDDEAKIKSMLLSPCIKTYIDDPRIKTLAERSAWIGNDEAHYVRKQEDRDVSDMKSFITATVYFISMILITKDAETISPK